MIMLLCPHSCSFKTELPQCPTNSWVGAGTALQALGLLWHWGCRVAGWGIWICQLGANCSSAPRHQQILNVLRPWSHRGRKQKLSHNNPKGNLYRRVTPPAASTDGSDQHVPHLLFQEKICSSCCSLHPKWPDVGYKWTSLTALLAEQVKWSLLGKEQKGKSCSYLNVSGPISFSIHPESPAP